MRMTKMLLLAPLLAGVSLSVLAAEPADPKQSARLFIGNVSLALIAVDQAKPELAQRDIGYAEQNIDKLGKEESHGVPVRVGRLTYTIFIKEKKARQERNVLIPFDGDVFSVQLDGQDKKSKLRRTDAAIVYRGVAINVKKAKADLAEASKALQAKDHVKAAEVLQHILAADIGKSANVSGDRLQSSYDHLVLADNLLQEKEYAFSRLALRNAQKDLVRYASTVMDERIKAVGNEIQKLYDELKEEDPSLLQRAGEKIKGWIEAVKERIKDRAARMKRKP